jgi:hypothetical protein
LFNFDAELADFFTKFYEKTKDSFVFFQADHGIRVGPGKYWIFIPLTINAFRLVRDIPIIGELEDNNPFLFVIVPEKLRHNPSLMDQLRTNSRSLISQLDLYASAVQIAKVCELIKIEVICKVSVFSRMGSKHKVQQASATNS